MIEGQRAFETVVALVDRLPVRSPRAGSDPDPAGRARGRRSLPRRRRRPEERSARPTTSAGPIMTYREMIERVARLRGKRRLIVEVPVLTPFLSSLGCPRHAGVRRSLVRSWGAPQPDGRADERIRELVRSGGRPSTRRRATRYASSNGFPTVADDRFSGSWPALRPARTSSRASSSGGDRYLSERRGASCGGEAPALAQVLAPTCGGTRPRRGTSPASRASAHLVEPPGCRGRSSTSRDVGDLRWTWPMTSRAAATRTAPVRGRPLAEQFSSRRLGGHPATCPSKLACRSRRSRCHGRRSPAGRAPR